MGWTQWFAYEHPMMAHLPAVTSLLLPLALVAAQRPGRGIRPWWNTCRYLGWMGLLTLIPAVWSGFLARRGLAEAPLLHRHQLLGLALLPVAAFTVWAMHRRRTEAQGIGLAALVGGFAWAGLTVVALLSGRHQGRPAAAASVPLPAPSPASAPPEPAPVSKADPEADRPVRALDHGSLEPLHPEPVRAADHGNRWVRAWASPGAADAWREGRALPPGAYLVLTTVEDRWGRPGYEEGPVFMIEGRADGSPAFTAYWPRVPEARRQETEGRERIYWRGDDPHLQSCAVCHAGGPSAPGVRSTRTPFHRTRPAAETAE